MKGFSLNNVIIQTTTLSAGLKVHSSKPTDEMLRCDHCEYTTFSSGHFKFYSRKYTSVNLYTRNILIYLYTSEIY